MSEHINADVHPAVIVAVHDAFYNAVDRTREWADEHDLGKKIAVVVTVGAFALTGCSSKESKEAAPTTTVSAATAADEACGDTWAIVQANAEETHRYEADGIKEIKNAVEGSSEDALAGFNAWFDIIKSDPELLAGTANAFMNENVTSADLQDANGQCATPRAQEISTKFLASVHMTGEKAPQVTQVPESATNSGTDANGNIVISEHQGVSGDLKGIRVSIDNGGETKEFYVLARCGNIAFPGETPPLPKGPTDNILKHDDGHLPGNPNVPADQDHGTPDKPGEGPAGQTPDYRGYLPGESVPTVPQNPEPATTTTTVWQTPATTSPQPTSTLPPVHVTTPPTTSPQTGMPTAP